MKKSSSEENVSLIYYTEVYSYLDQILFVNFSSARSLDEVEFKKSNDNNENLWKKHNFS